LLIWTPSVTGGAGTLGFEASKALLEHGLSGLMIFDVNPAQAQAKIDELRKEFPNAKIKSKKVDITDEIAVGKAVEETAELLGSVDILLCFAGVVDCQHGKYILEADFLFPGKRTLTLENVPSSLGHQIPECLFSLGAFAAPPRNQ